MSLLVSAKSSEQKVLTPIGLAMENVTTVFELQSPSPFMIRGITFRDGQIFNSDEGAQTIHCGSIPLLSLKTACYEYLSLEVDWKSKVLVSLKDVLSGGIPRFSLKSGEILVAKYSEFSEEDVTETVFDLLDWVELNHLLESSSLKSRFIRAALVLAGVMNADSKDQYQRLLKRLWTMVATNHLWTDRKWAERLSSMNGSGAESENGLRLVPMWKRQHGRLSLELAPQLPDGDFKEMVGDQTETMKLPDIPGKKSHLFVWSPEKLVWKVLSYSDSGKSVAAGNTMSGICGCAYALGRSANDMDFYFGYSHKASGKWRCKMLKPYFENRR